MSLLDNIAHKKTVRATRNLQRTILLPQLDKLQSVGVINNAENEEDYQHIVNYFQSNNVEIEGLFFSETSINNATTIGKKELTWLKLPKKEIAQPFIDKEFDILFNLVDNNTLKTQYLHKLSKARFKVAFTRNYEDFSDLIINNNENKPLKYLIEQVFFYIKQLNNQQ